MGSQHPTDQERRAIQRSADQGDQSARDYLELLDTCLQVLEGSNGISLAWGLVGEHNDIYGQAVDDALSELMPVIYKISANGWESLKWYVPREQRKSQGTKNRRERAESAKQKAQEAQRQADMLNVELLTETTKTLEALLQKLPANYPPAQLTYSIDGYMLMIDHTIIYQNASPEEAVKHTTNYVQAREGHPDLPVGVIYGIYD